MASIGRISLSTTARPSGSQFGNQIDAPRFEYQEWLCPGYDCGSSTLRTDGVHFRNTGQLQRDVMEAIVPQVVSAAGY